MQCECPNCGWTGDEDDLGCQLCDVPDLLQRIDAGEEVPAGECPECGALAHHKEEPREVALVPSGDRGKKKLPVEFMTTGLRSKGFAEGASCEFDWYNDRLQILVFDRTDEPVLHVRFNKDGTIAEIMLRDCDVESKCFVEQDSPVTNWQHERDGENGRK